MLQVYRAGCLIFTFLNFSLKLLTAQEAQGVAWYYMGKSCFK